MAANPQLLGRRLLVCGFSASAALSTVLMTLAPGAYARTGSALAPPSIGKTGHKFVPATGDWEGTTDGFPVSFELTYEPGFEVPYAVTDLVRLEPGSCPTSAYPAQGESLNDNGIAPLQADGSLGLGRYDLYGGLTGSRQAKLWSNISYQGSAPASCLRRLTFQLHPAHRRTVDDGSWLLRYSDGEAASFNVAGGGRIARTGIPREVDRCYPNLLVPPEGDLTLFIGPTGHATANWGQVNLQVSVEFGTRTATGAIVVDNQTCAGVKFPLTASLRKPSS